MEIGNRAPASSSSPSPSFAASTLPSRFSVFSRTGQAGTGSRIGKIADGRRGTRFLQIGSAGQNMANAIYEQTFLRNPSNEAFKQDTEEAD